MRATPVLATALLAVLIAAPLRAQPKQEREASTPPGQLADVGKGQRMGRQELKPGAYITPRYRKAVQAYLAKHHGPGKPCLPGLVKSGDACAPEGAPDWKMGVAVPKTARALPLPAGLAAALPKAPPGNSYVLLGGDILLIATASRVVVDAVPAVRPPGKPLPASS
ncbi:MAG: hypothetical protein EOO24_27675 [Comamonadaceae bacterium]|nr:MAG: hypothetical protein EOO24_27675 [Comamonadaceae bacterium]